VEPDAVDQVTVQGRYELPHTDGVRYVAFTDPSGGSQDSWTLAVAHLEQRESTAPNGATVKVAVPVLDALREWVPPFSPEAVVADGAALLKTYGVTDLEGDHYGGMFPKELFRHQGITYRAAEHPKSDLYREWLPLLNAGRMALLDVPRIKAQFCNLERKVARSGQESIDHAPGGHDDVANAVAGALVRAARKRPVQTVRFAA
jgi:hypothetical protein